MWIYVVINFAKENIFYVRNSYYEITIYHSEFYLIQVIKIKKKKGFCFTTEKQITAITIVKV